MREQNKTTIAALGECMLEISSLQALAGRVVPAQIGFGGDTANTCVYLSRLGIKTQYVSALGDDCFSDWIIDNLNYEGVGTQYLHQFTDRVPGLYAIQLSPDGERSFKYWRDGSPAATMLDDRENQQRVFAALSDHSWIYLSGISLGILSNNARQALLDFLAEYRHAGGKVVFDGNYRPMLWGSSAEAANAFSEIYALCDIAMPTFEDEVEVFGHSSPDEALEFIAMKGVPEVILKLGEQGSRHVVRGFVGAVPAPSVDVVDTTSAGDSFNAGFMAARLYGHDVNAASAFAHRLASTVVQHRGAIIERRFMPSLKNVANAAAISK